MPRCQSSIAHQPAHSKAGRAPNGSAAASPKAPQRRDWRTSSGRRPRTTRARRNASSRKRPQAAAVNRSARSRSSSSRDQRSPSVRFRSMSTSLYDMVVIGGGTAGLVASRTAAGLGARVVLIERDEPRPRRRLPVDRLRAEQGPDRGRRARPPHARRRLRGAHAGRARDRLRARDGARARRAQATIEPEDSAEALRRDGVEVIAGTARFAGPGRIEVEGARSSGTAPR